MSDSETSDPYLPFIVEALVADEIAQEGVFAICARLIRKGVFDDTDARFVCRYMREAVRSTSDVAADISKMTHERIDKREAELIKFAEDIKANPPAGA